MQTSLVTGGAGFIGSNLVRKLLALNHKVIVLDDLSTGFHKNLPEKTHNLVFYQKSINANLKLIFRKHKIDYIFHLAAQIDVRESLQNPLFDARVNILGSLNLLEEARRANIKKFIYASTGGALYGEPKEIPAPESHSINPLSCYGASKFIVEKYLAIYHKLYNLPYIILRYANVYGPRQNPLGEAGVVAIFINQLLQKKGPKLFAYGKNERDYVFVEDVVEANLKAMYSPYNKAYNIGTGQVTSTRKIFVLIEKQLKTHLKPKLCPARPGEVDKISLDSSQAKKELPWEPRVSLEKGIKKTVKWFKDNLKM